MTKIDGTELECNQEDPLRGGCKGRPLRGSDLQGGWVSQSWEGLGGEREEPVQRPQGRRAFGLLEELRAASESDWNVVEKRRMTPMEPDGTGLVHHKELNFNTNATVYLHLGLAACNWTPFPKEWFVQDKSLSFHSLRKGVLWQDNLRPRLPLIHLFIQLFLAPLSCGMASILKFSLWPPMAAAALQAVEQKKESQKGKTGTSSQLISSQK